MIALADAHCHFDAKYFEEGAEAVMKRAREAGLVGFVVVGLADAEQGAKPLDEVLALVGRAPGEVAACVGIHPHDAAAWTPELHEELRVAASAPEAAAVGEIGLDYHYEHSPRETQRDVFARLIALAREVRKPIVVHTRQAADETLELLASENARDVGGVIHCFSEDRAFAERALDLDFHLSFSGIVTFKNAHAIKDVAAWAPVDRILLETDSPYLAPVPLRGKRCEPAYVVHTARHVAMLRGVAVEDLAAAALANTERRFGKAFSRRG
jgi:TatD DNase family protein